MIRGHPPLFGSLDKSLGGSDRQPKLWVSRILRVLSGAILVATGLFQLTGLKKLGMTHYGSPFAFLMHEWGDGVAGAII